MLGKFLLNTYKMFSKDGNKTRGGCICDTVAPLSSPFDAKRYMGTWYAIQHSKGAPFQSEYFERTKAEYSNLDLDSGTFDIYNSS